MSDGGGSTGEPLYNETPVLVGAEASSIDELSDHSDRSPSGSDLNSPPPSESQTNEITALSMAFRQLMTAISCRVLSLADATHQSVTNTHRRIELDQIAKADLQIKELNNVIAQCEGLESELLKIRQIGEIAADFKIRLQSLEKQLRR